MTHYWQFLSSTQSQDMTEESVRLDFGLGNGNLAKDTQSKWPYNFDLVYTVKLSIGRLETSMCVTNAGKESFDFMCLFHSHFRIDDILTTSISGLQSSKYVDKLQQAKICTQESSLLTLTAWTDRVYTPLDRNGSVVPLTIYENGKAKLTVTRNALPDATVWNMWEKNAELMPDFMPKDAWKQMICLEPGAVRKWIKLGAGETWEGGQLIEAHE